MKLSLHRKKRKNRRPFRLTRGGWVFILYTIGIGAGAINTGNNLIYLVFGLFLGMILASGVLSDLSLWGLSAQIQFPLSIEVGQHALAPVRVTNGLRFFPSMSVRVEMEGQLRGQKISASVFAPVIHRKETFNGQFVFTPARRGWFQMKSLRFSTQFPFGLLTKWWHAWRETETSLPANLYDHQQGFFVCPKVYELSDGDRPQTSGGLNNVARAKKKGEGVSLYGIREFRPSDNPKRIHWKASAKRAVGSADDNGWLVKEMEFEQDQEATLLWPELESLASFNAADLEEFLSYTASLIRFYSERSTEAQLVIARGGEYFQVFNSELGAAAVFPFLAIFDPQQFGGVSAFLRPAPFVAHRPLAGAHVDVLENFQAWQKGRAA